MAAAASKAGFEQDEGLFGVMVHSSPYPKKSPNLLNEDS